MRATQYAVPTDLRCCDSLSAPCRCCFSDKDCPLWRERFVDGCRRLCVPVYLPFSVGWAGRRICVSRWPPRDVILLVSEGCGWCVRRVALLCRGHLGLGSEGGLRGFGRAGSDLSWCWYRSIASGWTWFTFTWKSGRSGLEMVVDPSFCCSAKRMRFWMSPSWSCRRSSCRRWTGISDNRGFTVWVSSMAAWWFQFKPRLVPGTARLLRF